MLHRIACPLSSFCTFAGTSTAQEQIISLIYVNYFLSSILKHISNSSSLDKVNLDRDCVWIPRLILTSIEFYDFVGPVFFLALVSTSKYVNNTPLCVVFLTLFLVFGYPMRHCLSCLTYYMKKLQCVFLNMRHFVETERVGRMGNCEFSG